jgi:hypothetical protein
MSLPGTHDSMTGSAPITTDDLKQLVNSSIDNAISDSVEDAVKLATGGVPAPPFGIIGGIDVRGALETIADATLDLLAPAALPIAQLVAQTQTSSLQQQLSDGVRALDVRIEQANNQFEIVHGHLPLGLSFDNDVLRVATDFLAENPTETIVMQVQVDNHDGTGNTRSVDDTFHAYEAEINPDTGTPYGDYIWQGVGIPSTLGAARGKIVIIQSDGTTNSPWNPPDPNFASSFGGTDTLPLPAGDIFDPIQNTFQTADPNYKWQLAQNEFVEAASILPPPNQPNTFAVNYLSTSDPGSIFSSPYALPYFMATGSGGQLVLNIPGAVGDLVDLVTGVPFVGEQPVLQFVPGGDGIGMNGRAESYINSDPLVNCVPAPLGIVFTDFAPTSLIQSIYLANPSLQVLAPANQTAVEGAAQTFNLGSFSDDPANSPWTVDVNWGDGSPDSTFTQTATGQIDPGAANSGHTYSEEGNYTITVELTNGTRQCKSNSFTVALSDPPVVLTGGLTFNELEGSPSAIQPVAAFTDPGGPENDGLADTYVATIHWSDGSPDATATLANGGIVLGSDGKTFFINVAHISPGEDGSYTISTTVNHESVVTGPITSTLVIKDNIGILLLDPSGMNALQSSGNGRVTVSGIYGGAILVNSMNSQAAIASGNASVSASEVDVAGASGPQTSDHASFNTPEINVNEAPYADPLASLPTPSPSATPYPAAIITGNNSVTLSPGTYLGGITVSGQASVTLMPGVYILEGGGFNVSGQANVTGQQVMIFNAPTKPNDAIQVRGQATLTLTAPINGVYQGIAIFQDRVANAPTMQFSGLANVQITGTIYAAGALTQVKGSAVLQLQGSAVNQIGAHLIVSDLQVSGNGVVTVDASFNNLALFTPAPPAQPVTLSLAQITIFVTATLPNLVNVSYTTLVNDNPPSVTESISAGEVQGLALQLIDTELASVAITDLNQLMSLELGAIDQALVTLLAGIS